MQEKIKLGDVYFIDDDLGPNFVKIIKEENIYDEICFDQIVIKNNDILYGVHYYEHAGLFRNCIKRKVSKKDWYKLIRRYNESR